MKFPPEVTAVLEYHRQNGSPKSQGQSNHKLMTAEEIEALHDKIEKLRTGTVQQPVRLSQSPVLKGNDSKPEDSRSPTSSSASNSHT